MERLKVEQFEEGIRWRKEKHRDNNATSLDREGHAVIETENGKRGDESRRIPPSFSIGRV